MVVDTELAVFVLAGEDGFVFRGGHDFALADSDDAAVARAVSGRAVS